MTKKKTWVPNITCRHCAMAIQSELSELPGVDSVEVDVGARTVTIQYDEPATWEGIQELLVDIGYPAVPVVPAGG